MHPEALLSALFGRSAFFGGATNGMQSAVNSYLVLTAIASFAARSRPTVRVLEVGSWLGASALTWAYALDRFGKSGEVVCVDPWKTYLNDGDIAGGNTIYAQMDELARTEALYHLFCHNAKTGPSSVPITHRRASLPEVAHTFEPGSFDVVYIDGSHYYEDVRADIAAARGLVRDGGILCGDDLELQIGVGIDLITVRKNIERDYMVHSTQGGFHPGVSLAVHESIGVVPMAGHQWFIQRHGDSLQPCDLLGSQMYIAPHWSPEMKAAARHYLHGG